MILMEERIQKILSHAGFGSRRACEMYITAGRIRVNGQVAQLGQKADPEKDNITLDGSVIPKPEALVYVALNKPRGVLSTVEAQDMRPTVRDLVPLPGNLYPVGRLDAESEGLILLTNDGELANKLTHPKYGHEKEYRVLVARQPDERQLAAFKHGVVMEDGYRTAPAKVHIESFHGKGAWLTIILHEGRKRQIRETCTQVGLPVVRIVRVRMGSLQLGSLKPREWRSLTPAEVNALKGTRSRGVYKSRKKITSRITKLPKKTRKSSEREIRMKK
jgi:23S rRNA pseudouridine2605 synthase